MSTNQPPPSPLNPRFSETRTLSSFVVLSFNVQIERDKKKNKTVILWLKLNWEISFTFSYYQSNCWAGQSVGCFWHAGLALPPLVEQMMLPWSLPTPWGRKGAGPNRIILNYNHGRFGGCWCLFFVPLALSLEQTSWQRLTHLNSKIGMDPLQRAGDI